MSDYAFTVIAGFAIIILPLLVVTALAIVSEMRDRAYRRGFDDAWTAAIRGQRDGRTLV